MRAVDRTLAVIAQQVGAFQIVNVRRLFRLQCGERLAQRGVVGLISIAARFNQKSGLDVAMLHQQTFRTTVALAVAGFGCNGARAPASPASGLPSAGSSTAPSAVPSIVGTVLLSSTGKAPTGGGVVYLQDTPKQPGVATAAAIDVKHKAFSPFISVITTGGTVTFGNKDALTHHVFSPEIQGWDTGYLQKDHTAVRTFESPGVVALLCNIHPEMLGYVLVIPSTSFGKLGADGKYVIANVAPGTYGATAWVPRMLTATQSVTVGPTGTVTANFELHPADTTN
jgi:plastocyanin